MNLLQEEKQEEQDQEARQTIAAILDGVFNMPLTKTGKKVLRNFQKEYGSKKGKGIFYAWEHKHKSKTVK